jgi:hypothetical protein
MQVCAYAHGWQCERFKLALPARAPSGGLRDVRGYVSNAQQARATTYVRC